MSTANDLLGAGIAGNPQYQGYSTTWNGTDEVVSGGNMDTFYVGYNTNFGAISDQDISTAFIDQPYQGYSTNWGTITQSPVVEAIQMDNKPTAPHPKTQQIYCKLSGFNTSTQLYEVWIIAEDIVPRPELFDPTRNPPNVDLSLFLTPPSRNNLSNIKIVARWIQ